MAVTFSSFIALFPELEPAGEDLVTVHIAAATLQVDTEVWRGKADLGIHYLAAHHLAVSPFGVNAKLAEKDGSSTYQKRFQELEMQVAPRALLI